MALRKTPFPLAAGQTGYQLQKFGDEVKDRLSIQVEVGSTARGVLDLVPDMLSITYSGGVELEGRRVLRVEGNKRAFLLRWVLKTSARDDLKPTPIRNPYFRVLVIPGFLQDDSEAFGQAGKIYLFCHL
jgi:hypothetical protein